MAAKIPQQYLQVDPWAVVEKGFHPQKNRVSESMFCLANELVGSRGYFDEGYSGDQLIGTYVNGLWEEMDIQHPQVFKGIVTRGGFGPNTVDWLYTRLTLDGQQLDLATSKVSDFIRTLNMKDGTMSRSFVWQVGSKRLRVTFLRFMSMVKPAMLGQQITLEPLNFSGKLELTSGLDFSPLHEIASGWTQVKSSGAAAAGKNLWTCPQKGAQGELLGILGRTLRSGQYLHAAMRLIAPLTGRKQFEGEKIIGLKGSVALRQGESTVVRKLVSLRWEENAKLDAKAVFAAGMKKAAGLLPRADFQAELDAHVARWHELWDTLDITIDGDDALQQGVRFSVFNMFQTYNGRDPHLNIPCKGLTAEVYFGWVFWDTETYCVPVYLFTNPTAARNLLMYRYEYLPQALERAEQLGCKGARYPFATIDGTECCGTWNHCDLEMHVDVAVSYAIWLYDKYTGDKAFLYKEGIEMLLQISRYLASRGEWHARTGEFGFFGVMGPDEYHMMINNNCYTNWMGRKTFQWTLATVAEMKKNAPEAWAKVAKKVKLADGELDDWKKMARKMRIPRDEKTGIYEQHDGYFDLPEVDVKNLPNSQIPIYKNWVYEKIFRHNMIKQPDFLLLPLFFGSEFDLPTKRKNFEYYEARCIHESSLSPGVHSILAAELGNMDMATEFFRYMARLDLDNYNLNTEQGLHITAMSGVWLNVVNGFGGMRTDGPVLSFAPVLPKEWNGYSFRIVYKGAKFEVKVDRGGATFTLLEGPAVSIDVYGNRTRLGAEPVTVKLPRK
jgi:maltose phosphorylase